MNISLTTKRIFPRHLVCLSMPLWLLTKCIHVRKFNVMQRSKHMADLPSTWYIWAFDYHALLQTFWLLSCTYHRSILDTRVSGNLKVVRVISVLHCKRSELFLHKFITSMTQILPDPLKSWKGSSIANEISVVSWFTCLHKLDHELYHQGL